MKWVSILEAKPPKPGHYYWQGKSGHGGYAHYSGEIQEGFEHFHGFDLPEDTPVNKISDGYFCWLDESASSVWSDEDLQQPERDGKYICLARWFGSDAYVPCVLDYSTDKGWIVTDNCEHVFWVEIPGPPFKP